MVLEANIKDFLRALDPSLKGIQIFETPYHSASCQTNTDITYLLPNYLKLTLTYNQ